MSQSHGSGGKLVEREVEDRHREGTPFSTVESNQCLLAAHRDPSLGRRLGCPGGSRRGRWAYVSRDGGRTRERGREGDETSIGGRVSPYYRGGIDLIPDLWCLILAAGVEETCASSRSVGRNARRVVFSQVPSQDFSCRGWIPWCPWCGLLATRIAFLCVNFIVESL